MKESFTGPKKLDTIDTPHGKLTKAPEGGSLGDFQGQKVKAEMDFPDGHKAKSLENGKCAVCSNCDEINKKFKNQLAKPENAELSTKLKELEAKIAGPPKPSDTELADLVAQQKALHDKLEIELYRDTVPNGKLTDKQIQDKLDANKKFDPDTKRFGKPKEPSGLQIKEYTAPVTGKKIRAAVSENVAVPLDKIEIYARGKVQSVKPELDALQRFKQSDRKLFDADPNNAKKLQELKDKHHNFERSQGMNKELEAIGLKDDVLTNQKITENLLEVGKKVTPDNRQWVPRIIEGPNGKLMIESTWKILDDGTAYLTTLKFMPIK